MATPRSPRQPRDRNKPLQVYVNAKERDAIKARAASAGLTVSNYLRSVAVGADVRSVLDLEAISTLAKISGDQGRLGGLLKMYLMDQAPDRVAGERLIAEIAETQAQVRAAARSVRCGA